MQTFLPYPDFEDSLNCLDNKRLGKQRVEASQLIAVNVAIAACPESKMAWRNHPAAVMWRPYLPALVHYYNLSLFVWKQRGFNNVKLLPISTEHRYLNIEMPWWLGDKNFHKSHRSNLLRKNFQHYAAQFPDADELPCYLEYLWPTEVVGQFTC